MKKDGDFKFYPMKTDQQKWIEQMRRTTAVPPSETCESAYVSNFGGVVSIGRDKRRKGIETE
jgi:hypothetical protein